MGAPPQHSGPFGHPALQSPLTRSRAQLHLGGDQRGATSIRHVSVPHKSSVEEGPTVTLLTSEVDDPRIGRLASPLLEQKR